MSAHSGKGHSEGLHANLLDKGSSMDGAIGVGVGVVPLFPRIKAWHQHRLPDLGCLHAVNKGQLCAHMFTDLTAVQADRCVTV